MEYTHVYPVNDLIKHNTSIIDEDYACQCNPSFEYDFNNNSCIVVHDAMDRRECFE